MKTNFLYNLQREAESFGGATSNWYKEYQAALTKIKEKDKEIVELTTMLRKLQSSGTNNNGYPYTIKWCPGYEGYIPEGKTSEVCKNCGSISYYH